MAKKSKKERNEQYIQNILANENILDRNICDEMKESYLSYSLTTISSRALPDARDGLKPVQRRILFSMFEQGMFPEKATKKSARIIGDVLGKYHPHGDQAAYEAMTNMVNDFSIRYPLIKGQGNFGSIDDDGAAAMRYTEAKLQELAMELLTDINNNGIDMKPNFSEDELEPEVLPGLFPTLLANGCSGIATGYKTDIPPHNLSELADAITALIDNPDIEIKDLNKYLKGPDLPTGGYLINDENILKLYETGEATLTYKGKADIVVNEHGENQIVISSLPPDVKKPSYVKKLYSMYVEKKDKLVLNVRDGSEGNSIEIILELSKSAIPELIIKELYEKTQLSKTKKYSMKALINDIPLLLNLKQLMDCYIDHRKNVIERRTRYRLKNLYNKSNVLKGYTKILPHIKDIVMLIADSDSPNDAKEKIMQKYDLNEKQALAILSKELQSLTRIESEKIKKQLDKLEIEIKENEEIINKPNGVESVIKSELKYLKDKYGDERKTIIIDAEEYEQQHEELTNTDEPMFVGLTNKNNIKHMPFEFFENMIANKNMKQGSEIFVLGLKSSVSDNLVIILEDGNYIKCAFSDLLNYKDFIDNKKIIAIINDNEKNKEKMLISISKKGLIKKIQLEKLKGRNLNVIPYFEFVDGEDSIIDVRLVEENENNVITLATKNGILHRFYQRGFKDVSQKAKPLGCINLSDDDLIIGFDINDSKDDDEFKVLLFSKHQSEKISLLNLKVNDFNIKNRMAKGAKAISYYKKDMGNVFGMLVISGDMLLLLNSGELTPLNYANLTIKNKTEKPDYIEYNPIVTKFFIE